MARYCIYNLKDNKVSYVLDVQTNILDDLSTVVVIPLITKKDGSEEVIDRLKPIIEIDGSDYILMTTDISAFPRKALGDFVCNIEDDYSLKVIEALDFLFQGF